MSNKDEDDSQEPKLIEPQHDIPTDEPKVINLNFLLNEERNIDDGEFFLRPQEKFESGYAYAVQMLDSTKQLMCYVFKKDNKSYGWCPCSIFGDRKMCKHLAVAHKWERGMLKPENEEIAQKAKRILDGEIDPEDAESN
jgi:hypothetical protein